MWDIRHAGSRIQHVQRIEQHETERQQREISVRGDRSSDEKNEDKAVRSASGVHNFSSNDRVVDPNIHDCANYLKQWKPKAIQARWMKFTANELIRELA